MIPTALIAFREFLEAFLIVGVFFGISQKMKLGRNREIVAAAGIGILFSLVLSVLVFMFGNMARNVFTHERTEILEGYLMVFSGFFLAYVVFSLHDFIRRSRGGTLIKAHESLKAGAFDISLFFTIVFLVIREGFEIALFTASTSLFAEFGQNLIGLAAGFAGASAIGLLTYFAYIKLPIGKIFKATEYMIIVLGAALVQRGFTEVFEYSLHIELSDYLRFPMGFLPAENTFLGHLIKSFTGLDHGFSMARLSIMIAYVGAVYFLFLKKGQKVSAKG